MHCGWVLGPQLPAALAGRPAVTLTPRIPLKRGQPTSRMRTVQPCQPGVFGHCQVEMSFWRVTSGHFICPPASVLGHILSKDIKVISSQYHSVETQLATGSLGRKGLHRFMATQAGLQGS